jgi:hypothetical protein
MNIFKKTKRDSMGKTLLSIYENRTVNSADQKLFEKTLAQLKSLTNLYFKKDSG